MPGGAEIWIILIVVLVIFGPTQLPKLAKMFGKSAKALKEGIDGTLVDEDEKPVEGVKPTPAAKDSDSDTDDKA
jgi:sec-independent protein translocase protein TatA